MINDDDNSNYEPKEKIQESIRFGNTGDFKIPVEPVVTEDLSNGANKSNAPSRLLKPVENQGGVQELNSSTQEFFKNKYFISELTNNATAAELARQANEDIKNQEKIAAKITKVVQQNTNADIETAEVFVKEKNVDNKVKKQQLKNTLLKLKKERLFIKRDEQHRLQVQKLNHRKEKYSELLTRHKKVIYDKDGNMVINLPNAFVLFFLVVLDSIVQFLNLFTEVLSKINKTFLKGFIIFLIILFIFLPPFRNFIINLIGIKFY